MRGVLAMVSQSGFGVMVVIDFPYPLIYCTKQEGPPPPLFSLVFLAKKSLFIMLKISF